MDDDTMDAVEDFEYACPLNRSDSLREALLEIPTAEGIKRRIRSIKDISGQFVEDVDIILETCGKSSYVVIVLHELAIDLAKSLNGDKERITVAAIQGHTWNNMPNFKRVDTMHILQTILSRDLPPERFGGIINLELAMRRRAPTEEVEDSLRYLYGSGSYAKIANIPPLPPKDLRARDIDNVEVNGITVDKLKSIVGLRPQVIADIEAIFEAFPHDNMVTQMLFSFANCMVEDLHGDAAKIDVSTIRKYADDCESEQYLTNATESILSTRLPEEAYCGLIKLMYAFAPKTSDDDIEKALEYLYG